MTSSGILNLSARMQDIGLGPGSPGSWADYPLLSPLMRDALDAIMTPAAYKALHYHPDSFGRIFGLYNMKFNDLAIFKVGKVDAVATELVFEKTGSIVETLLLEADRKTYRPIFDLACAYIRQNHHVVCNNLRTGNTQDVNSLVNMAFAFPMKRVDAQDGTSHMVVQGFYPYFSNCDETMEEFILFFFHKELNRLVLISVPMSEREHALNFILAHGAMHTFDKICARCGKTGGLQKCSRCKGVRYCSRECQAGHWASHKMECK